MAANTGNGTNDINSVPEERRHHGDAVVPESDTESYNMDVDAWHAYNLAVGGIPIPSGPTANASNTEDRVYQCGLCGLVFPDLKAVCWHTRTHPYRPYGEGIPPPPPPPPPGYFLNPPAVGSSEAMVEQTEPENQNATPTVADRDAAPGIGEEFQSQPASRGN